ncbi:phosphatidate cytidylyltransferase [Viscerimonas tarda]
MKPAKNLIYRILTGIVFVFILLGSILYSQYSYGIVLCTIEIVALFEFYNLIAKSQTTKINNFLTISGGFFIFGGTFVFFSSKIHSLAPFLPYIFSVLLLFIWELYLKKENPIRSLAYSVLGQVYIAVPFSLLNYLAYSYDQSGGSYHYSYLLALFIVIWVNDSFAYTFGVTLGKHRLFERISPKKSWEGFIGGAVCAVLSAVVFAHYFDALPLAGWLGFALIVVVFGTFGDLIESLLKRTLNVKDSGTILPGHGGILDRFDSMIFAIPALVVYLEIINCFR